MEVDYNLRNGLYYEIIRESFHLTLLKGKCMGMALKKYGDEQIQKMSMIELANIILADQKKEMNFIDL